MNIPLESVIFQPDKDNFMQFLCRNYNLCKQTYYLTKLLLDSDYLKLICESKFNNKETKMTGKSIDFKRPQLDPWVKRVTFIK